MRSADMKSWSAVEPFALSYPITNNLGQADHRGYTTVEAILLPDGDNSEWTREDEALFVSGSEAQATLRCSADEENVYFLVKVLDNDISRDDHINILLCPPTSTGRITSEARRIKVAPYGLLSTDQYAGGWRPLDIGATVDTRYDGSISDAADSDHGWLAEVAVPRRNLVIKDGCVLTNLVVFDLKDGEKAIAPTTSDSLAKWIPIRGL